MSMRCLKLTLIYVAAGAAMLPGYGVNAAGAETISVRAAGFLPGMTEISAGADRIGLQLDESNQPLPYSQSAVKQGTAPALLGPDPNIPYFTVDFALPVPPENSTSLAAAFTGMDTNVFTHNHSQGFEILPNGDALAIYFSTPPGKSESDPATSFIQARLRYGAVEWDLPELFFKFQNYNDQSGLLWNDHGTLRFFGGGRGLSAWVPFKMATSTDNGATWTLSLPQLEQPAEDYAAQPITSAFRAPDGSIYFAMDGGKAQSFLWRSRDDGGHWHQMKGRTGGRHSVIVPLDGQGDLLSIGGKNASIHGWSPENLSTNWGASWSRSVESPFPPLGSAQRPSLIRLADGNLFFVSDAWLQKKNQAPPAGWKDGDGCFVAISTNQGISWQVKPLPVQLPNHEYRKFGTVGYVTARQGPNGVIHILTTETQPCLHYELNEAWIFSDAGDVAPETKGGSVKDFSENFPDGTIRSRWSARICPHGRYLLEGRETDYYDNGNKQHEVTYAAGRKTGMETFWSPDGKKLWSWSHDLQHNTAIWIQYWPDGRMKSQSSWNTQPEARDLPRSFFGLVANGPAYQWAEDGRPIHACLFANGVFAGDCALPKGGSDTP
jgi:BNR repeat-like domain